MCRCFCMLMVLALEALYQWWFPVFEGSTTVGQIARAGWTSLCSSSLGFSAGLNVRHRTSRKVPSNASMHMQKSHFLGSSPLRRLLACDLNNTPDLFH
jgi:hypothetical protein